ncbi:MAG TPA: tyrosine--tRNA ligase, partial [Candidatus Izemoplasmatales bacterium]|nr:tyrosine--tRNA ligase [Candidatus Izemoplasmatales bacterium]
LFAANGCQLQIGGQDQWGNITSGLELIRKVHGSEAKAYGFTFPLVTKADGTKFGKSESGSVWLDPEQTSPYDFYQFWINTADDDMEMRLKQFTFLSPVEIQALLDDMKKHPEQRNAQKALARELTVLVHGEEAYREALHITNALFTGNLEELTAEEIAMGFKDLMATTISADANIIDVLLQTGLASSKRDARELLQSGAVSINGERVTDFDFVIRKSVAIGGMFTVLRKGKKKYSVIRHE